MLLELNKFERKVFVYLFIGLALFALLLLYFSYKKNWFTATSPYYVQYKEGSGLLSGSMATIAGMKVGYISSVTLNSDDNVTVELRIFKKYKNRIKTDSIAKVIRPYGIGKKLIQITQGGENSPPLVEKSFIKSRESSELIDILSGNNLDPYISTFGSALDKIRLVLDKLLLDVKDEDFIKIIEELRPLVKNFNEFTVVMGSNEMKSFLKHASGVFSGIDKTDTYVTAQNVNKISTNLNEMLKKFDKVEIDKLISNLEKLLSDMSKISGELPAVTTKSLKVLDESLWVLKGMQQSWFLKEHIDKAKKKDETK